VSGKLPRAARRRSRWLAAAPLAVLALIVLSVAAGAQTFSFDLGAEGGEATGRAVQLLALITVLSLAPSILIMLTSFTRIIIVLSFMRQAMGVPQTPPTQVLIGLALFLTLFIMMPTFQASYDQGIRPLIDGQIDEFEAFDRAMVPVRDFMMKEVREQDLALFVDIAGITDQQFVEQSPMRVLIPAFMISELRRAFEMGFLIFLPFLVIDMVVASVLMSMGMMMLPPVIIALPFKIIFFVLVDGWYMLVGSLVRSFG
jgi:flagellar biosynthetic protein FliP